MRPDTLGETSLRAALGEVKRKDAISLARLEAPVA
jgi:hypothetical protein